MSKLTLLLTSVLTLVSCNQNSDLHRRLKRNAQELLQTPKQIEFTSNSNNPTTDIVNIGQSLHQVISSRNIPLNNISIKTIDGDFFENYQNVTHSIIYNSKESNTSLKLRMRYDSQRDKFHIVGFTGGLTIDSNK